MTPLSVSFKATLKAMNTIKFQIHVKKMPNLYCFQVNTLTHLCKNDFIIRAYFRLEKSEIAKIYVFHFGPKTAKNLN